MKDSLIRKIGAWQVLIEDGEPFASYFKAPSLGSYQSGIIALAAKYPAEFESIIRTAAIGQESNSKKVLQDHLDMPKSEKDDPIKIDLDDIRGTLFGKKPAVPAEKKGAKK